MPVDRLADAFDRTTVQLKRVADTFDRARLPFRVLMVVSVLEFILVCITFPSLLVLRNNASENHQVLRLIESATGPKAQAAQRQQLDGLVNLLIACEENHTDRVAALRTHQPLPVKVAGCPKDPTDPTSAIP